MRRISCCSNWSAPAPSPACGSITRTVSICPRNISKNCSAVAPQALGLPLPEDGRAIYLLVEKILSGQRNACARLAGPRHDRLRIRQAGGGCSWSTRSAEQAITKTFQRFIGHSMHFGHLVYAKKRLVMRLSLANDVNVLGDMLDRLSEKNRWFRDFTLDALARAVRETIACFPVYRTYVTPGQPVSEEDRAVIERAVTAAKRRNPALEESVFNFLRDILLFRFPGKPRRGSARRARAFRSEIPAVHRADHGQGARGHRVLYLQPAGGAERSGRRAAAFRHSASTSFTSAIWNASATGRRRCWPLPRTTPSGAKTCARAWWRSRKSRNSGAARCSAGA